MTPTRREFLRNVGIGLASLALARCGPAGIGGGSPRERLRACWLRFDWLARQAQGNDGYERGQRALDQLTADHRSAIDELVDASELERSVADHIQVAFADAGQHVMLSNAPITCYEPMLVDYTPVSSAQLVQQADLLVEMAETSALDPGTVAQAQAAIERDIAFLNLSPGKTQALYDALIAAAGDGYVVPGFEEVALDVTPEAAEAAQFLVDLLLGD